MVVFRWQRDTVKHNGGSGPGVIDLWLCRLTISTRCTGLESYDGNYRTPPS